jgi:hypothetical protein
LRFIERKLEIEDYSILYDMNLDMSGTNHFWSWSWREKVLGLGPGPFRNKFWCRSQSKIFWSRFRSKKTFWFRSCSEKILVLIPVKERNLVPVSPGPLCPSLYAPIVFQILSHTLFFLNYITSPSGSIYCFEQFQIHKILFF